MAFGKTSWTSALSNFFTTTDTVTLFVSISTIKAQNIRYSIAFVYLSGSVFFTVFWNKLYEPFTCKKHGYKNKWRSKIRDKRINWSGQSTILSLGSSLDNSILGILANKPNCFIFVFIVTLSFYIVDKRKRNGYIRMLDCSLQFLLIASSKILSKIALCFFLMEYVFV